MAAEPSFTAQLVALLRRPITPEDRARAALHVLDWIGCATIGATTPPGLVIKDYGRLEPGGPCKALGVGDLRAEAAAFVNGAFGNVLEMDDIHRTSILHPGPVVVPAALAAAQAAGAETDVFLDALVRGYEVVVRIGISVGRGHYKNFHNTSTCGPFGAAAAVGSILGLSDAQMVDALGNAGTTTGGLWQVRHENAMSKQLHNANAARHGLLCGYLAKRGFTGPAHILEGPNGLYRGMCGPDANPAAVTARPEAPWMMYDTSFKPWAACRHSHSTIDAALKLRREVPAEKLDHAVVRTYADAVAFCDRPHPETVVQAKFSLQHAVAVVLADGPPRLDHFEPKAFKQERFAKLRARVSCAVDPAIDRAFPEHYGAAIDAWTSDGRKITIEAPEALGDPGNPVEDARIVAKARELMAAAGLPAARIDALVQKTLALGRGGTVEDVAALLP
jgi:2-methylcitrate dehydratase PrpD